MVAILPISLNDRYCQPEGEVFLSGMQALVRLCILQRAADETRGLATAGFVSGYRGSPIGGLDRELQFAEPHLLASNIRFQPGLNEDLAATSCWGTQQLGLFPGSRCDGVFSMWYGKNPGLDRSTDAIRHASHWGTSKHGGVLAVVGDDHVAKSSAFGHQSEYTFMDCLMPVVAPSNIEEILTFGLFGWALSRYCGAWVGLKLAGSICEGSAVVRLPNSLPWEGVSPSFEMPADGVHIRWPDEPGAIEYRARSVKLPAALAFASIAGIDRLTGAAADARLGIVAAGRAYAQVCQALKDLRLEAADLLALGIRIYKPGMVWPLEPQGALGFAQGLKTILVVEDKRPLIEDQLKVILYEHTLQTPPIVIGKRNEQGGVLIPEHGEVDPLQIAVIIGERVGLPQDRIDPLRQRLRHEVPSPGVVRTPYFCAGCPHNTSTLVPKNSIVIGGIGCHTLAMGMDRDMLTFSHMGGEGATWIGLSPFTDLDHVFQNMGDGTYQHSGSMGIRAAVAAGVNITFKILYNDAVAMTGGQAVEGPISVPRITHQLQAEGVNRIIIVTDEPEKYGHADPLAAGVGIFHRDKLDDVQRLLRETPGVTALIYDQTCAAEKRRRRKRGTYPDPARRVVINELVCEGCGDCGVQSNCLAIVPSETPYGTRRQIDQQSCNKDFSCLKGFCPSFVTVEGGRLRNESSKLVPELPPPPPPIRQPRSVLIAGIGGTGVVTLGAILGIAARVEGRAAVINDVTGMAQKGGAVLGHIQVADTRSQIYSERIAKGDADVLIAVDLVVATMQDALSRVGGKTCIIANVDTTQTGNFTHNTAASIDVDEMLQRLRETGASAFTVPALRAADAAQGSKITAGMLMLGIACQQGLLPVSIDAIKSAIELNGSSVGRNLEAFNWGRWLAIDPESALGKLGINDAASDDDLDAYIDRRSEFLKQYQNQRYADRFLALVSCAREAEENLRPLTLDFTKAVVQSAFRLMAYKDEYEVARLHTDPDFQRQLGRHFEGNFRLVFHLAPPLISRRDSSTGIPRKIRFGAYILPVFHLLKRLKWLRGSLFDPFGWTTERRTERKLIGEFELLVAELALLLNKENHGLAVALAEAPQQICGFGHVKARKVARFYPQQSGLLEQFRATIKQESITVL